MSPARVAALPTEELCIDKAIALSYGGNAPEGMEHISLGDIDAALSERGADCTDQDYTSLAAARIHNQQVEAQNMTQGLINAAAIYQATHPQPVYYAAPQYGMYCTPDANGGYYCQ